MKELKRRLEALEIKLNKNLIHQAVVIYKDGSTKTIPETATAISLVFEEGDKIERIESAETEGNGILLGLLNALLIKEEGSEEQ